MTFNKEFYFDLPRGLVLKNIDDRNLYMKEKIEYFSDFKHYTNKDDLLSLFDEIANMCINDRQNSIFNYSGMPQNFDSSYKFDEEKMIKYYNVIVVLGGIFLNVFNKPGNQLSYAEEGNNGAISTSDMFIRAYNELCYCASSENISPAYGATLIFATLFEKDLKTYTKQYYVKKYLSQLLDDIKNNNCQIQAQDSDLFEFLLYTFDLSTVNNSKVIFDGITATTTKLYDFLLNYNLIPSNNKNLKLLIQNKITLTPFFKSQEFLGIADYRFAEIVKILFDPKELNLRNNLAHCNFDYQNYYSLQTTALLYVLFTMISNDYFLK